MPEKPKPPSGNKTTTVGRHLGKDIAEGLEDQTKLQDKQNKGERSPKILAMMGDSTFNQIGIAELLDKEERPVFVIDVGDPVNYAPGSLQLIYANSSLKLQKDLMDLVLGKTDTSPHSFASTSSYADFKAWVTSFVKDFEDLGVTLPSFPYGDVTWICSSTLRKRIRIVNGQSDSNRSANIAVARDLTPTSPDDLSRQPVTLNSQIVHLEGNAQSLSNHLDFSPQTGRNPMRPKLPRAGSSYTASLRAHRISSKRLSGSYQTDILTASKTPLPSTALGDEAILGFASAGDVDTFRRGFSNGEFEGFFDWTRLPISSTLPPHIQFARNIDWQGTPLGPIEEWPSDLRGMCNLIMARHELPPPYCAVLTD